MATRIFVTATNTDVGKTYTTLQLLRHYAAAGYRVGAIKPIETGVTDLPPDGAKLLQALHALNPECSDLTINDVVPIRFPLPAAPYVANDARPIDLAPVEKAIAAMEARCDILLIEGAGGLFVPVDPDTMIIDLIRRFKAKALLVSHCRLGCINDALLNLMALDASGMEYRWVLNRQPDDSAFESISAPYLRARFEPLYILQENIEALANSLLG